MIKNNAPLLAMPIKVKPFAHQIAAFNFVCNMFGLIVAGGDSDVDGQGEVVHHIDANKLKEH